MDFTHIANPVRVRAVAIVSIYSGLDGDFRARLADGSVQILEASMVSRYKPVDGDYVVIQEDGYIYINPKDVFERKYSPILDKP